MRMMVCRLVAVSLIAMATACSGVAVTREGQREPPSLFIATAWSGHPVGFDLLTRAGRQFVAFYDAERYMTVASRLVGEDQWKFKRLPSRLGWDSHNHVTLAMDANRQLHVAGNMHATPLTYFRTTRSLDIDSLTQVPQMVGREEDRVTYPRFLVGPAQEFLFTYRHGGSGNGDIYVNVYDVATKRWARFLDTPLLAGEGSRSAYEYGPVRDRHGTYHLTWRWRDTPDGATNHTLSYARSRDLRQWETSGGMPLGLPITLTTGEVVDPVPPRGGLRSQRLGFDAADRPIISYHKYDAAGLLQLYNARREDDRWRIYQASTWRDRWEFGGWGSGPSNVRFTHVRARSDGALVQTYWHWKEGGGMWTLDPRTLQPVEAGPLPGRRALGAICDATSPVPEMEVRLRHGRGALTPARNRYALRWETLPVNRDRPRAESPPPTELRLYELPWTVTPFGCLASDRPRRMDG